MLLYSYRFSSFRLKRPAPFSMPYLQAFHSNPGVRLRYLEAASSGGRSGGGSSGASGGTPDDMCPPVNRRVRTDSVSLGGGVMWRPSIAFVHAMSACTRGAPMSARQCLRAQCFYQIHPPTQTPETYQTPFLSAVLPATFQGSCRRREPLHGLHGPHRGIRRRCGTARPCDAWRAPRHATAESTTSLRIAPFTGAHGRPRSAAHAPLPRLRARGACRRRRRRRGKCVNSGQPSGQRRSRQRRQRRQRRRHERKRER